jgi:stearoyl-CoA desaturase (delta-9 desaturase)
MPITLSWPAWFLLSLGITQVIILLVTVYFHRACAHRSVVLSPSVERICRFLAWFLISMDPRQFAAVHRKHHAKCDTDEDPHSPVTHGWYGVLLKGLPLYQKEASNPLTLEKYGKGLPVDPWEKFYQKYPLLGILFLAVVLGGLLGWKGMLLWSFMMLWIPFWAAGVVNGLGHHFGYRNFQTDDLSTNLLPWGFWIGGEELHNNHHAYPSSARFSRKPWEFDLGWTVIRCLKAFGLASIREDAQEELVEVTNQSFLRDRHVWLLRFQDAINDYASAELAAHGFSNWRQLSRWSDRRPKLSSRNRARLDAALAHPSIASLHGLEADLRRFWQERGRICSESLASWRARAHDMGWDSLNRFCEDLPVSA